MSTMAASPLLQSPDSHGDRVVLRNVPWDLYECLGGDDANRHVRMSYYKGTLELMSPRYRHAEFYLATRPACHDDYRGDGHPLHRVAVDHISA